ncbi:MAG: P-type conjugative transfer protein TrbL, partial [Alphaproteobacteria bacterium]|nr:P-type conjugative transfer protein TrbL [Alphaproteobacteria bacterium]
GAFAFIINNFSNLADIIFNSFSTLGLQASNNGLTAQDLLRPGKLAGTGFQAAWPLLQEAGHLMGFSSFFNHIVTILVLVGAWFIVVLAFFFLAVQLFITILEFKLTTLAGFVLVPFALWNKTAFLAERVLGYVVSSGVKVMVLAVIIGIGSSFFGQFIAALKGHDPTLADAMSLVLAALSLFGLGIFGPGIASGLVSGAPQLGAGAALGTAGALIGGTALAGAAAMGTARFLGGAGLAAIRAGTSLSTGAATAYGLGRATFGADGMAGMGAGLAGVARAAGGAAAQGARDFASSFGIGDSAAAGRQAAWRATGGSSQTSASAPSDLPASSNAMPSWARRLHSQQRLRGHAQNVAQAIKEGDRPAHGATPNLREDT